MDRFTIKSWCTQHHATLGQTLQNLAPRAPLPEAVFTPLRETDALLVMRVQTGPLDLVIKAFNPDKTSATHAYRREINNLAGLARSGLVPMLRFHSKNLLTFACDFVPGDTIAEAITPENALEIARDIGAWFARATAILPRTERAGNWYEYLRRYDDILSPDECARYKSTLENMPITHLGVAKNDAHLSNFIRKKTVENPHSLVGFDFEASQLKPIGWDIMLSARSLVKACPSMAHRLPEAIVAGWAQGAGPIPQDAFVELVEIFVRSTAHKSLVYNRSLIERYRLKHNQTHAEQADLAFLTPSAHCALAPVPEADKTAFLAALTEMAQAAMDIPKPANRAPDPVPHGTLGAMCAACGGQCCTKGGKSHAYLSADKLAELKRDTPDIPAQEMVARYAAHLPEHHMGGSCLYHGALGCCLPREMRAPICNRFYCEAASALLRETGAIDAAKGGALFVAQSAQRATRAMRYDHGELREITPESIEI